MNKYGRLADINLRKLIYSPVFVYFTIWIFFLSLYATKTLDYGPLSNSFYFGITLNFLGLLLGCMTVMFANFRLNRKTSIIDINLFTDTLHRKSKKIIRIFYICCLMSSVGVILMYLSVFNQISLRGFFAQQATVKAEIHRSLLGTYLSMGTFVALPLGVLLRWSMGRSRYFIIFPLLLCALFSFSFWGRVPFVTAFIIIGSCKIMLSLLIGHQNSLKQYSKRYLLKMLMVGVLVIILAYSFLSWTIHWRVSEYGSGFNPVGHLASENVITRSFHKYSFMFGSYRAALITWSYLFASIPTLNYWISQDSEYGMGQASFPYFFRLFHKLGLTDEAEIIGERPLGRGLQLPSFIGYAYIDFGFLGILIYSYILGFVSTLLYRNFFKKPCLGHYMYLSLIYVLILLSPQICATTWTSFPITFVGMFIVNRLIGLETTFIKTTRRNPL